MLEKIIGYSIDKSPIRSYCYGKEKPHILLLAGVHGDEIEGVWVAKSLCDILGDVDMELTVTVIPECNPDGINLRQRGNAAGVDLNRNLPTVDWDGHSDKEKYYPGSYSNSEPETQALVSWIGHHTPSLIVSLHSWHPVLNVNGDCYIEASVARDLLDCDIVEDIGYPTPGCLGTYAGLERSIPTITYEIERGSSKKEAIEKHIPALLRVIETHKEKYDGKFER